MINALIMKKKRIPPNNACTSSGNIDTPKTIILIDGALFIPGDSDRKAHFYDRNLFL